MAPALRVCLIACACACTVLAKAQYGLESVPANTFTFERGGVQQTLASIGGLNNPQLSYADVTGDGKDELYVFDRDGDVHIVLQRDGDGWKHDPKLTEAWPATISFSMLRDFNADGTLDLFAYSQVPGKSGVEVYQGMHADGTTLFEPVEFVNAPADILYDVDGQLMYSAVTDIPAIQDLDGDGDLDMLTFNSAGGYINHYENISAADASGAQLLMFRKASNCYGGVFETDLDGTVLLADAPGACAEPNVKGGPSTEKNSSGGAHAGSTIAVADIDGDGDNDLLLGDVGAGNVTALINTPANGTAYFTDEEYGWPTNATAVQLSNFPAVFPLRENGGAIEYLVSPSNPAGGEDYDVLWRYKLSAESGELELQQHDYLVREALDHGQGAHPALGDLSGDGVDDLLVGNDFTRNGDEPVASFSYYVATSGGFVEQTPTWVTQLNTYVSGTLTRLTPLLYDVDADGAVDLLFGSDAGLISFARNTAGPGSPATFAPVVARWQNITVSRSSAPALGDVTGDGLADLLVGQRNGQMSFFPNTGTASEPQFSDTPLTNRYGEIEARVQGFTKANLVPAFANVDGDQVLYIGTGQGRMLVYNDLPADTNSAAQLLTELTLKVGNGLSIAFGTDVRGDALVAVGNARGGLNLFGFEGTISVSDVTMHSASWQLAPNPAQRQISLQGLAPNAQLEIYNATGQCLYQGQASSFNGNAPAGLYFVTANGTTQRAVVLR